MNYLFPKDAIIRVEATDSTNNYAKQLVSTNEITSTSVIMTQNQLCGRGQQQNTWESEVGKNLTISLVLFPNWLPASHQFYLSMVVALGVADFLKLHLDTVAIKWPNDIYVGDKKICGILIENTIWGNNLKYAICGIGVNINQQKFYSDAPNPISLSNCTGSLYDLDALLQELLECVTHRYLQLQNQQLECLNEAYLKALYRKDEVHQFEDARGVFLGEIVGVTEFGQLRIKVEGVERIYNFKEVVYL